VAKDKKKPEDDPFKGVRRSEAKKKTASKRIRGRMGKIGAPISEVPPRKKEKKPKKGEHRKDNP
jgi:hypothetical protein